MTVKKAKRRVAIVIPAYNEAGSITNVVRNLNKTFKTSDYDFTIVVVDDGSKDETYKLARKAGAKVICHVLNTGTGGATATGLSYAQQAGFSIAATVDADGQHDPDDLMRGIQRIEKGKYDLLIGSRLINSTGMSRVKLLGNKGLSFITYILFGVNVTDSQSGMRVFSERALNDLRWKTSGFEFCSEMIWRAKQQKLRIGEYPIKVIYTEYSITKGQNNWNAFNIVKSLVRRRVVELFGE